MEALNDAVMRARFDETFPPKKPGVGPLWEAIRGPRGQDGRNRFIAEYRDFYE